jgi:serine/threonine protein kinase
MNGQYEYSEIDKLGQGGYGSVYLGQSMLSSSRYAIKVVQINPSQEEALLKSITDEVGALSKVNHENIVKFIDLHVDQSQCRVYIVSEFCEGKTLKKFAEEHYHQHGHGLSEEDIDNILGQVVNAFCYLHSLNIHHRDIKPDNIMINAKGQIKLLDFGLAKQTSHLEDL